MEKNSKIGLTAGAFMACSGAASAGTISQTNRFTSTPSWSHTWSFEGADTLLPAGTRLTGVQFQVLETLDASFTITNTSGSTVTFTSGGTDVATATLPGTFGKVVTTTTGMGGSTTLPPGGTSFSFTLTVLGSNTVSSPVFTSGLSAFMSAFDVPITDMGNVTVDNPGEREFLARAYAGAAFGTVTYTYTAVPEPTTVTLIGIGLASLGAARRRKKKDRLVVG